MDLQDLCREVGELPGANNRTNLEIKRFINRAVRAIGGRKDWTWMRAVRPFVILSGNHSVSMGSDYKCLSTEDSPVSVSYNAGPGPDQAYQLPVRVLSLEEIQKCLYFPYIGQYLTQPIPGGYVPLRVVYFQYNATGFNSGTWRMHVPPQFAVVADSPYNVSAYYYPPPLVLPTDHNACTDDPDLADAVVNYAKSLKYSSVDENDTRADKCMARFEDHFTESDYTDSFIKFANRGTLRM